MPSEFCCINMKSCKDFINKLVAFVTLNWWWDYIQHLSEVIDKRDNCRITHNTFTVRKDLYCVNVCLSEGGQCWSLFSSDIRKVSSQSCLCPTTVIVVIMTVVLWMCTFSPPSLFLQGIWLLSLCTICTMLVLIMDLGLFLFPPPFTTINSTLLSD